MIFSCLPYIHGVRDSFRDTRREKKPWEDVVATKVRVSKVRANNNSNLVVSYLFQIYCA